jgi:hypothetical protein
MLKHAVFQHTVWNTRVVTDLIGTSIGRPSEPQAFEKDVVADDVEVDVDWGRGHGAITPSHLGLQLQALCAPPFSSARHLHRRSTSCDIRRTELRARNGRSIWPVIPTST